MSNIQLIPDKLIKLGRWVDYRKDVWGDSFSWDFQRATTDVKFLVIHHSVTAQEGTQQQQVDHIAELHKQRGWGGIGYHFVIGSEGVVFYVGDLGTGRANVENQNEKVIGICLVGDFTKQLPTDEQIQSAHLLCEFLIGLPQFPNIQSAGWDSLKGHKEFKATACPGDQWNDLPDSLRNRIINNIPYKPQVSFETPVPSEQPIPSNKMDELTSRMSALEKTISEMTVPVAKIETLIFSVGEVEAAIEKLKKALRSV